MLRDADALKGKTQAMNDMVSAGISGAAQELTACLAGQQLRSHKPIQLQDRLPAGQVEWLMSDPVSFEFDVTLAQATIILPITRSDFAVRLETGWQTHPVTAPIAASFLPAKSHVSLRQRDEVAVLWVKLGEEWMADIAKRGGVDLGHDAPPVIGLAHPDLVTLAASARMHLTTKMPLSGLFAECLAMTLYLHVLNKLSQPHLTGPMSSGRTDRVARSVAYIDGNVSRPITIKELAAEVSMSPYHFARSFKEVVGVPPHRYVILRRIEHAKTLLQNSRLSIAEIAFECGFSSQSHLTSAFKTETGLTPLRYRQSILNG